MECCTIINPTGAHLRFSRLQNAQHHSMYMHQMTEQCYNHQIYEFSFICWLVTTHSTMRQWCQFDACYCSHSSECLPTASYHWGTASCHLTLPVKVCTSFRTLYRCARSVRDICGIHLMEETGLSRTFSADESKGFELAQYWVDFGQVWLI